MTAAGTAAPASMSSRSPMLALCGRAERRSLAESGAAHAFARLFAEALGAGPSAGSATLDFSALSSLPNISAERLWDGRLERFAADAAYGPASVRLVFDVVESLPALEAEAPEEVLVRGLPLIVIADGAAAPAAEAAILARAETDSVMCALSLEDATRRCGLPCRWDDARPMRCADEGRRGVYTPWLLPPGAGAVLLASGPSPAARGEALAAAGREAAVILERRIDIARASAAEGRTKEKALLAELSRRADPADRVLPDRGAAS